MIELLYILSCIIKLTLQLYPVINNLSIEPALSVIPISPKCDNIDGML